MCRSVAGGSECAAGGAAVALRRYPHSQHPLRLRQGHHPGALGFSHTSGQHPASLHTPTAEIQLCVILISAVLLSHHLSSYGMLAVHVMKRLQHSIALQAPSKAACFMQQLPWFLAKEKPMAGSMYTMRTPVLHTYSQTQHAQACELLPRLAMQCQPVCNANAVEGAAESPSRRCWAFTFSH